MPEDNSVCVIDFCGRCKRKIGNVSYSDETTFSADYFPSEQLLYFTGEWGKDIPAMPSDKVPTESQAYEWARSHGGQW